ncbi:LOW QUALITY PROTEIN: cingulin [Eutrema salsugineum]|uniref:LOW QUALITY PROTEIN: cingulin n=1 Tax=Eutrema salsugineum TaxID=72664 RepID=UPI000CED2B61|nr:LOW QUALITY PROTEIN: cingulin [Eutrema salsugineum]
MLGDYGITEEDMVIEEAQGYPRAYAKICRDFDALPYRNGPPFTFIPYILQQPNESSRCREVDQMFPVIDPKARPTTKPKIFLSLLWKQLNHLGNAGFDPAVIRIDPYGNVLYFHADSASPLAWGFDHWFPCSRGGLTVPSNLRIVQWQARKNKKDKLEFLVPWWDLQVGISVNQFLSIFAASSSDFRRRAFSFLFKEGESEELNGSQTVDSHHFPQHFVESKDKFGLASAAVVVSRRDPYDPSLVLRSLDYNRQTPARKMRLGAKKENETPDLMKNPYQALVAARDSLRHREEAKNMRAEMKKLDDEMNYLKRKNSEEQLTIQELESELIKRRRRAEKCRRLAEAQCSYRNTLEKMIRDAMHQSVVYKEQVRLNQAASSALMARLEAQKAICDGSEKELHKKFKEREELENQVRPELEKARKRSRLSLSDEDDLLLEDRDRKLSLYLPGTSEEDVSLHKELRVYLEEEHKAAASEAETRKRGEIEEEEEEQKNPEVSEKSLFSLEDNKPVEEKLDVVEEEGKRGSRSFRAFPVFKEPESEEDEESRRERGKGNVEKWLHILLENNSKTNPQDPQTERSKKIDEMIEKLDHKFPLLEKVEEEVVDLQLQAEDANNNTGKVETESSRRSRMSFDLKNTPEKSGRDKVVKRSESARAFRRIPSSPSLIFGMKKGIDCIRKKPVVSGHDDENEYLVKNNFIKSSLQTIKRAVKF